MNTGVLTFNVLALASTSKKNLFALDAPLTDDGEEDTQQGRLEQKMLIPVNLPKISGRLQNNRPISYLDT